MNLNLDGKTVVVTGASRGIGLAITRRFAEEGARVIAGARTISDALAELATTATVESFTRTTRLTPGMRAIFASS